jgi:hypothetical protein
MNLKRGLFRLWLIGSALFVLGVSVTLYSSIQQEFLAADTDYDALYRAYGGVTLLPIDCTQTRGRGPLDFSSLGAVPAGGPEGALPFIEPDGTPRMVRIEDVSAEKDAGARPAVKMIDPTGTPRWVPIDQESAAIAAGGRLYPETGPNDLPGPAPNTTDYYKSEGQCWYSRVVFRRLYPEYKDLSDRDLSDRLYSKAGRPLRHPHPWTKMAQAAGIAIGFPTAVLTFACLLGWAISGFRETVPQKN